jgi:SulP family sulfate permease
LITSVVTLLTGAISRKWISRFPYLMTGIFCGTLTSYYFNHFYSDAETSVPLVGSLPYFFPPLSSPIWDLEVLKSLLAPALALAFLGLTSASSISRALALRTGQALDGDREFLGQGLSNLIGSFFSAYPSGGSFNRSGLNLDLGAKSPWSAIFSALFLVGLLALASSLIRLIPYAAMAGILFLVAWSLLDIKKMMAALRQSTEEAVTLLATFAATLFLPLAYAVFAGVGISLLFYLRRTSRPPVKFLVPDPNHAARKFIESKPPLVECPQLKIIRIEGSIYFGAVHHVSRILSSLAQNSPRQKHWLLMSKSINIIDVPGAEMLTIELRKRRQCGGDLYFYSLRESPRQALLKNGFLAELGEDHCFETRSSAVQHIYDKLDKKICETCTAKIFLECQGK